MKGKVFRASKVEVFDPTGNKNYYTNSGVMTKKGETKKAAKKRLNKQFGKFAKPAKELEDNDKS